MEINVPQYFFICNIVGICDYNNSLLILAVQFLLWTSSLFSADIFKLALFTKTPHQGPQTSVHCSIAPEVEGVSGKYCALKGPSKRALDDEECKRLWEFSREGRTATGSWERVLVV